MRAMVLAAGLGTRLRPLTDACPKALVRVGDRTLLELALMRLRSFGVRDVIVNVHHCAEMMIEYLAANDNFGMNIEVSLEELLLDTGGGLKRAAHFFLKDGGDAPFILHNVDVISTIDLGRMVEFHVRNRALATLAVQERETSRYLLFDEQGQLCGRRIGEAIEMVKAKPGPATESGGATKALGFCGVHVISPRLLQMMSEDGVFSIIPAYLRLAGRGEKILAFRADEYYWRDLGRVEHLEQAARDFANGKAVI